MPSARACNCCSGLASAWEVGGSHGGRCPGACEGSGSPKTLRGAE